MVLSNAERQARHRARLKALAERPPQAVDILLVVREIGRLKPDYSLPFTLPAVPREGDYISIYRPDSQHHTEDVVVRRVWWQLHHDETESYSDGDAPLVGRLRELVVECDPAVGPFARDHWRDGLERAEARGVSVERFDVARLSIREDELSEMVKTKDVD